MFRLKNEPSLCCCKELDDDDYVCCLGFSLASFAMLLYCKLVIPLQQFLPNHVYISELHDTHFTCHVEYGLSLSLECTR